MATGAPSVAGAFADTVLRARLLVLAAVPVLAVLAALQLEHLRSDNRVHAWLGEGDPALERYQLFVDSFGSDEYAIVVFETADAWSPETIATIDELTDALARIDHVQEVRSLTDTEAIWVGENGIVEVGRLLRRLPPGDGELAAARREVAGSELLRRTVVSPDGRAAAVIARIDVLRSEVERYEVVRAVRAAAERVLGASPHMAGLPVIDEALTRASDADVATLLPLLLGVIAVMLGALTRSVGGTLLCLVAVLLTIVLTVGIFAGTGGTLNSLTTAMPFVLLVVSLASSIHVVTRYREEHALCDDRRESLRRALAHVAPPCTIANLTTAIGFASFLLSPLPPLREFGGYTAVGVLISWVLALTVLPAALSLAPERRPRPRAALRGPWRVAALAAARRPGVTLSAAAAVAGIGAVGIAGLQTEEHWLEFFEEDAAPRRAVRFIESSLSATESLETVFVGEPGAMRDPRTLAAIDAYEAFLRGLEPVERVVGAPDFLKEMNRAFYEDAPEHYALPDSAAGVDQYLLLLDGPGADVRDFLDADARYARVTARVHLDRSRELRKVMARAEDYLDGAGLDYFLTGMMDLNRQMHAHIITSQLRSFGLALPLIVIAIGVALRRVRLLPLIVIANLLPVGGTLGAMSLLGIPLNSGTVLVASIAIGLVVDDTVYLLTGMRREAEIGGAPLDVVGRGVAGVGHPIFCTTLTSAAGFGTLVFAQFQPIGHLGVLTSVTLLAAFAADLLVVPAVAARWPQTLGGKLAVRAR